MSIWELEPNSTPYAIMKKLIAKNHTHLLDAKIIIYANDKNKLKGNNIIIADASKSSHKMKASTCSDFNITLYMTAWSELNQSQQEACMDHELSHCGVCYLPITEQIGTPNKKGKVKTKIVKDEFGRVQYSNEIKRDPQTGQPKWKLIPHDLEEFRDIVERHGIWDDSLKSFKEIMDLCKKEVNN